MWNIICGILYGFNDFCDRLSPVAMHEELHYVEDITHISSGLQENLLDQQ